MTGNTFGLHPSTVSKVIHQVCRAISDHLGPKYLKIPKTQDEMIEKVSKFEAKYGMPLAFAAVDGTHIPVKRPPR